MSETILNNRYRLDAKIGEGGMAVVYRGYDLKLRRQVAIKLLHEQFAADAAFVERFYQEAQAAAILSHPNIVNTYDVGDFDGKPYIVGEFVQGDTLATLIAREGRLPEAAAVRYARQVCAALVAAQRHELLHRDIKPSNILITPEDVVRVADFGIARVAGTQTLADPDALLGSVPYCSPEQISGGELTPASDLYSLGVVLYEMVTGKRPYDADSAVAVAMAHLNSPVPDPAAVKGVQVSPQLRSVIRRLLQKSPRDRFQSAGELLAALRRCAADESAQADDAATAGPDSPTVLLKRRAALGAGVAQAHGGDVFETTAPRWRTSRAAAIAAMITAAIVLLALVVAEQQAASHSLSVPDLAGKGITDAVVSLQSLGLDVAGVQQRADPAVAIGLVDGTNPAAGTRIGRGQPVTLFVSSGPPTVPVPNVVGQDTKVAMDLLIAGGFVPKLGASMHSNTVKAGAVALTRPAAGSRIAVHGTIVLVPSAGPSYITVPNVVALTDADARKQLETLGLKLRINQTIFDASIPPHTIIDQDPPDGAQVQRGAVVTVDVNGGAAAVAVPDVVGGTVDDARNALAQAGLTVGAIAHAAVADTTPGTVVGSNPPPGTQVPQGTAVDLVVAVPLGPPGQDQPPASEPTPGPTASPGDQNQGPQHEKPQRAALRRSPGWR